MTLDIRTLAARLVARRTELRLEQTEVAERARLSRAYISRLESALVQNPKLFDLAAVAHALDVPLAVLVAPEPTVAQARYSHDLAAFTAEIEHFPPEIRERLLRGFLESVAVMRDASELARRN